MAKLTKLTKKLNEFSEGLSEVLDNVKTVVPDSISRRPETDDRPQKPIMIDSVKDLKEWISSMQVSASRSAALLLQSHLQVINFVNSPAISGIIIDNIIVSLYKSIEMSESQSEKKMLQDSFASLIQGVVFVMEARLQYEIKKNKEEAAIIISNANNMIAQSVGSAAILITTGSTASYSDPNNKKIPIINNIFESDILDRKTLARLASVKKKNDDIEDLKKEHNVMLNNLFKTLDKYFTTIGPSIQIHGLLSRYVDQLIEQYKESRHKEIESYISKFSVQWKEILNEINNSLYMELGSSSVRRQIQGLVTFLSSLRSKNKSQLPDIQTYEEVNHLYSFLKERNTSLISQVSVIKKQIALKQSQVASLGFFQQGIKSHLNTEIEELEMKAKEMDISLSDIDEKLRVVENVILPIKSSVEEYSANLNRIVEKFSI